MSAEPIPHPVTVEEFFARVPDGVKADLIDGVIYVSSPDTPPNDDIGYLIRYLLQGFSRRGGGLGKAHGSRVAFALGRYRSPEPDVSFVLTDRLSIIQPTRGVGAPDIAVEIVSADSVDRDYVKKRILYEEAGVREYWIIDPLNRRCTFLLLQDGSFVPAPLRRRRYFFSEVLPGFWLDVQWLLTSPVPDEEECLQRLLAGPPK